MNIIDKYLKTLQCKKNSAYHRDIVLAEGIKKEAEVMPVVILSLCIKLHLWHVNRAWNNAVKDLAITCTWWTMERIQR